MTAARVETDVAYSEAGRDLLCDLYSPEPSRANGAAVLLFHGGGLRVGSRTTMERAATLLAERGYLAVAPEYRLLAEAPWPAQLQDARSAVRWLRAGAGSLGVDPAKIALCGFSAGALLSLLVAGTADRDVFRDASGGAQASERVTAVVSFFSPLSPGGAVAGGSADEVAASPMTYASSAFPPTLLLHGTGDTLVPHTVSVQMFETLAAAGAPVDLRLYAGLLHEFVALPGMLEGCVADVDTFLGRHLLYPDRFNAALDDLRRVWEERTQARRAAAAG